jgi:hypothetical protein
MSNEKAWLRSTSEFTIAERPKRDSIFASFSSSASANGRNLISTRSVRGT